MKKIILARVDERLLHGQVVVNWLPAYDIDEIIIVDDEIANDDFLIDITMAAAPKGISVIVFAENELDKLSTVETSNNSLLLSKSIIVISRLLELGVCIEQLNLGGLSMIEGRKRYLDFLCLNEVEKIELENIKNKYDIDVFAQMIPNSPKIDINNL